MSEGVESAVVLRDVSGQDELREVEGLQRETWGIPDLEIVPATHLTAACAAGGTLIGAFDGGRIVGFVYGFPGFEEGRPTHHSHMLAVLPEYRNHHLGRRLKLEQRQRVLAQGVRVMTWTFDPLQSLNANFNFSKLGVISDRYLVNFYGSDAASFLHRNGTDRLWVSWLLDSGRVRAKAEGVTDASPDDDAPPVVAMGEDDSPVRSEGRPGTPLSIEIPLNIGEIEKRDFDLASAWRQATRAAFTEALAEGRIVSGFVLRSGGGGRRGAYILTKGGDPTR